MVLRASLRVFTFPALSLSVSHRPTVWAGFHLRLPKTIRGQDRGCPICRLRSGVHPLRVIAVFRGDRLNINQIKKGLNVIIQSLL